MVRELRRTHLRLWLLLGPMVLVAAVMALLTRGPTAIPTAEQARADSPTPAAAEPRDESAEPDPEVGP